MRFPEETWGQTKPNQKNTKPNKEKRSESLGVMLQFWYIERGLLVNALPHSKLRAYHTPLQRHVHFGSMVTSFSESFAEIFWKFRQKQLWVTEFLHPSRRHLSAFSHLIQRRSDALLCALSSMAATSSKTKQWTNLPAVTPCVYSGWPKIRIFASVRFIRKRTSELKEIWIGSNIVVVVT